MRDVKKHVVPAGSDPRTRADLTRLSLSAHTIVPVGGQTERDQITTDLTAAGYAPSVTDPLYVHRLDTDRVEVNTGGGWSTLVRKAYDSGVTQVGIAAPYEKVVLTAQKVNRVVVFTGIYKMGAAAGAGSGTLCTIPAGMLPVSQQHSVSAAQGTGDMASMTVTPTGTVTLAYKATVSAVALHYFGMTWVTA